jgi:hypothetical protein
MKAYLVTRTFPDGNKEGVFFTEKPDADDALEGCDEGSSLAVAWTELYGDDDCELTEIEI